MVGLNPTERRRYFGGFCLKPDKIFKTYNRALISTVTQLHTYWTWILQLLPEQNSTKEDINSCRGNPSQTPAHPILWRPTYA